MSVDKPVNSEEECTRCKEIVNVRYVLGNIYCCQCQNWIRNGAKK